MRTFGKIHNMVCLLNEQIKGGAKVAVAGCENPDNILKRLIDLGTKATAEPMFYTTRHQPVFGNKWGEIVGYTKGKRRQTGFLFKRKDK